MIRCDYFFYGKAMLTIHFMVLYLPSYRVELKNEEIILLLYNSVIWVKCQKMQYSILQLGNSLCKSNTLNYDPSSKT